MREVQLVESIPIGLDLTPGQLSQLEAISQELASDSIWWGESDSDEPRDRRVVDIRPLGQGHFFIQVRDAVGTIQLTDLQLIIIPKIPMDHFAYIARHSFGLSGQTHDSTSQLSSGQSFFDLVFEWFVSGASQLVQAGLSQDYMEREDSLTWVRGKIDPIATFSNFLQGRPVANCDFQELTHDVPLNQLLATAFRYGSLRHRKVSSSRKALALHRVFGEISSLPEKSRYFSAKSTPRRYREVTNLALAVLRGSGRSLDFGGQIARSFLLRTPPIIENGIRNLLSSRVAVTIRKGGRILTPTHLRVNPDLEVGPPPLTADVKYKIHTGSWNRADLAQAVFFAAAYRSPYAAILSFTPKNSSLPEVPVGDIKVSSMDWFIGPGSNPESSAAELIRNMSSWSQNGNGEILIASQLGDWTA